MSRKYRQRGYQEDAAPGGGPRRKARAGPREGPTGRGLGAPTDAASTCAQCGKRRSGEVEPTSSCRHCGADLHTCTNCRHFDAGAANECRAGVEVRIAAKAKRNECPSFEPRVVMGFEDDADSSADPKAAFDALFDL